MANIFDTASLPTPDISAKRADQVLKGRKTEAQALKSAKEFEAIFIAQMLKPMFEGLATDGPMGGGHAESVYRGMQVDEFGKAISKAGGIGLADNVFREIMKHQEVAQ